MRSVLSLDDVLPRLGGGSLVRGASVLPSGYLRLETPFRYPDGTSIELFLPREPSGPGVRLTDLGQTTEWLLHLRLKPWLSQRRQALLDSVLRIFSAHQDGGQLVVELDDIKDLASGVIRLAQCCLRVADLSYTRRASLRTGFAEEVEELLGDSDLAYAPGAEIAGRGQRQVHVDFVVRGATSRSLILAIASQNASAAHARANEVFRSWYDLDMPERTEQRVTVFDDRSQAYRDDDLARLEELSLVLPFSDREGLRTVLAA